MTQPTTATQPTTGTRTTNNTQPHWETLSVGSIVTSLPAAAALFRAHRVDFCCGGHKLLGDVLAEANQSPAAIVPQLDLLAQEADRMSRETDHAGMPDARLAAHIDQKHHTYMHRALPHIGKLSETVLKAHGRNHPELFRVHSLFGQLRAELEQHLIKEEVSLFPLYGKPEADSSTVMLPVIRELRAEHEAAGTLLKDLRHLTQDYTVPADGCATWQTLYEALEEMEGDLFEHIHLENNILFERHDKLGKGE
jgi:regulator of cell morphogenesis and NO signaling